MIPHLGIVIANETDFSQVLIFRSSSHKYLDRSLIVSPLAISKSLFKTDENSPEIYRASRFSRYLTFFLFSVKVCMQKLFPGGGKNWKLHRWEPYTISEIFPPPFFLSFSVVPFSHAPWSSIFGRKVRAPRENGAKWRYGRRCRRRSHRVASRHGCICVLRSGQLITEISEAVLSGEKWVASLRDSCEICASLFRSLHTVIREELQGFAVKRIKR